MTLGGSSSSGCGPARKQAADLERLIEHQKRSEVRRAFGTVVELPVGISTSILECLDLSPSSAPDSTFRLMNHNKRP